MGRRPGSRLQTFAPSGTLGTIVASRRLLRSRRSILQLGKLWHNKMPGDAKLETAVELLELYNNPEKLKAYKYTQPIVSTKGINNEKFHMELPYQEIKSIVEKCGADLLSAVPPEERAGLRWEHVGSTSIEGMPGAMMPDALLILPSFPPTKGVIQVPLLCNVHFLSPPSRHSWTVVTTTAAAATWTLKTCGGSSSSPLVCWRTTSSLCTSAQTTVLLPRSFWSAGTCAGARSGPLRTTSRRRWRLPRAPGENTSRGKAATASFCPCPGRSMGWVNKGPIVIDNIHGYGYYLCPLFHHLICCL